MTRMATITIRDLDELVIERLRFRAELKGISLEEAARQVLAEATKPTLAEIAARAAEIRASQKPHKSNAVDLIREDRDR
jgi:plasmid stability protein